MPSSSCLLSCHLGAPKQDGQEGRASWNPSSSISFYFLPSPAQARDRGAPGISECPGFCPGSYCVGAQPFLQFRPSPRSRLERMGQSLSGPAQGSLVSRPAQWLQHPLPLPQPQWLWNPRKCQPLFSFFPANAHTPRLFLFSKGIRALRVPFVMKEAGKRGVPGHPGKDEGGRLSTCPARSPSG